MYKNLWLHILISSRSLALQQLSHPCYHFVNVSERAASTLLRGKDSPVCHTSSLLTFARFATEMSCSPAGL